MLLAAALAPTGAQSPSPERERYVVVVSPDVEISNLTREEVRRIFLFERRYWKAGHSVKVLLSESALQPGSFVLEQIYETDYGGLRRLVLDRMYNGELDMPPKFVQSNNAAVKFVASLSGLVTLVPLEAVEDSNVKVLSIDGKQPSAEDYPLQR